MSLEVEVLLATACEILLALHPECDTDLGGLRVYRVALPPHGVLGLLYLFVDLAPGDCLQQFQVVE